MKTLYLIDGHAQFFRAFHAIRTPMSSPVTKEPTNATFGFVGMMLKLFRQYKPDYVAVAIDVSGDRETFRSEIYPEYKATRTEPPESFGPQVERCVRVLREVGVPVVFAEGFEADDVIATLATRVADAGVGVRIVSKDKDLKQLLRGEAGGAGFQPGIPSAPIELFDIHTDLRIDPAHLMAEQGIRPDQVIDMLTLMGDSVDNVPGVDGVGPKTAAELMQQYGTLDNLIAHADEIKGKRGEKLREAIPRLALSKQLITLRHDAPVSLELHDAETARFRLEKLIPICKELGFNRYQDEVRALLSGGGAGTAGERAGTPADGLSEPRAQARGQAPDFAADAGPPRAQIAPAPTPKRRTKSAPATDDSGGTLFAPSLFAGPNTPGIAAADAPAFRKAQSGSYRCIRTLDELRTVIAEIRGVGHVAVDTETTGLSPLQDKLCGVCLSTRAGEGVYVPVRSPEQSGHLDAETVLRELRPILEDPAIAKYGHNLKFDLLVLRAAGVELSVPLTRPRVRTGLHDGGADKSTDPKTGQWHGAFDSMVASYLIDASRSSHSMDNLALGLLGRTNISIKELLGPTPTPASKARQKTFNEVDLALATEYAAEDADVTMQLHDAMAPRLREMGLQSLFDDVEMPLVRVLADLEWNGIRVEPDELERQRARLEGRIKGLAADILAASPRPFNPDSPKQLAEILFNKPGDPEPGLGLKPGKKLKTGYSTDIEVLEKIASDPACSSKVPALILEYRQLTKLVSTYLVALREAINPDTGRIHASFHQTVAATGRLASSDPNLQNIPIRTEIGREIRKAFVPEPGHVLVSADYSQIELRILAHLSGDPALKLAFERGEDIHTAVAAQVHNVRIEEVTKEQRSGAKMVNFGIVYGVTPFGLARRLGCSNAEADEIITGYKKKFAGITTFLQECIDHAQRHGYVETILKRRRPILGIESPNPQERALAERTSINSVVQGSAADLIKVAMVDIARDIGIRAPGTSALRAGSSGESVGAESRRSSGVSWPSLRMLLQIHDELVFECPEDQADAAAAFIVERMEGAMKLSVPLKVDAAWGRTWFEGK
ncbi:MAG: DNA polymerase I [Phycisphaerales bacterium]